MPFLQLLPEFSDQIKKFVAEKGFNAPVKSRKVVNASEE
jgi:hypothetical protein